MKKLTIIGFILSLAVISGGFWLYFCGPFNRPEGLNELGDFLSGSAATLAFLWLVIGYFQQGQELSANTKALQQAEEQLQLSAEAQSRAAKIQERAVDLQQRIVDAPIRPVFLVRSIVPAYELDGEEKWQYYCITLINIGAKAYQINANLNKSTRIGYELDWNEVGEPAIETDGQLDLIVGRRIDPQKPEWPCEVDLNLYDSQGEPRCYTVSFNSASGRVKEFEGTIIRLGIAVED